MAIQQLSVDYGSLTQAAQMVWSSGDFNEIARQSMAPAEKLCAAVDPRPGQSVLDVACGSGNVALVAARRHCRVAGIDFAPNLIERARMRAAAEGTEIDFRVADAQELPYPDESFDVVASVFGVMFAPDQEKAAHELLRVCRPGGKIALASWMPSDFGFDLFSTHARHAPPPEGAPSPLRWGTPEGLDALMANGVRSIKNERVATFAYYRSIDHAVELFERYFGPTIRAMGMVGKEGAGALRADLAGVFERYNRADDGTAQIEMAYLQSVAVRG